MRVDDLERRRGMAWLQSFLRNGIRKLELDMDSVRIGYGPLSNDHCNDRRRVRERDPTSFRLVGTALRENVAATCSRRSR
jgi:hypothetical protein